VRLLGIKRPGRVGLGVAAACCVLSGACDRQSDPPVWDEGGAVTESFLHYDPDDMEPAHVCESIEAMGPELLDAEGLHPAAIFDLDNTVWSGQAIDPFLAALIELELISEDSNPSMQRILEDLDGVNPRTVEANSALENARLFLERSSDDDLPDAARVVRKDQFYGVAEIMAGLTPVEAQRAARHFFHVGTSDYPAWKTQFFASEDGCGMKEIIAKLRAREVDIYLVSASLDPIVSVTGDFLGVRETHRKGSPMEIEDGVYTGRVESLYAVKGPTVREWLGGPAILGFGDSAASDFDFMADVAGPVFMINPGEDFLAKESEHAEGRFVALRYSDTLHSLDSKNTPDAAESETNESEEDPRGVRP